MLIASQCRMLGTLPRAGGLLDQDPLMIAVLTKYEDAVRDKSEQEAERRKRAAGR